MDDDEQIHSCDTPSMATSRDEKVTDQKKDNIPFSKGHDKKHLKLIRHLEELAVDSKELALNQE